MTIAFINGEYTDQLSISPYDLGFLRGLGVFESFRTYDKSPLFLAERIQRLRSSAVELNIHIPYTDEQIAKVTMNLIELNGFSETNIRLIVTKGISHDGIRPEGNACLYGLATPFTPYTDAYYQNGIKTATANVNRPLPHVKSLSYLPGLLALEKARTHGVSEILYTNDSDFILEGTTSNFFGVKDDKLITAPTHILFGMTRKIVLEATKDHFDVEMRALHLDEISELDEAFITSSLREVVSVVEINEQIIGTGRPGPHTEIVLDLFRSALFQLSLN